MTSIATQLIHYIKRTPEILGNRDRFKSLLNDLFPNRRDFINILTILYFDIQIAEEFRRINKTDIYFISRISKKIVNEFHIDKLYAEEAVRVWIDCLTNINIEIPIQKPSEKTIIENQRKFEPENETIYIPCGVGYQDNGFKIKGIKTSDAPCEHYLANIYSIILGYHLRTLNARESRGFKYLQKKLGLITSYRRVYRLIILFLILIKNNYFVKNQLEISLKGFALKDANLAIETIN
ncbi:MAG: hypothetical protein FJY07_08750, partial [Bacteroidetes bacterium]|nr:hypothetical protein [Bacteroidota bacterium]